MRQQLLFGVSDQADEVHTVLRQIVDTIGLKEAAFVCDCAASMLSDALNGRTNKHVRISWALKLGERAPAALRLELVRCMAGPAYEVSEIAPLKPEDELRLLRDRVKAEFGAAGERLVEGVRR